MLYPALEGCQFAT